MAKVSSLRGNKGEWSETYVFLKLLHERKVAAADAKLNPVKSRIYPIEKIFRQEKQREIIYDLTKVSSSEVGVFLDPKCLVGRICPTSSLQKYLPVLLRKIRKTRGTFAHPALNKILKNLLVFQLKAASAQKADLALQIHDLNTQISRQMGFSIKSELGNPPTLLNAGHTTNFVFEVEGITPAQIDLINRIKSRTMIVDRVKKINSLGGKLVFCRMESDVFENNLLMVDTRMPHLVAEMLLLYFSKKISYLDKLVEEIGRKNPLRLNATNAQSIYAQRVKQLLLDCALGMQPGRPWAGTNQANGGYLILKENGKVVCFHIHDYEQFKTYLLENTRLESASTTRHGYAKLYEKNNKIYFNLNLQIRFLN